MEIMQSNFHLLVRFMESNSFILTPVTWNAFSRLLCTSTSTCV